MGSLSHFVNSFSLSDCPCSCHVTKTFNSHWLINFLLVNKSKLLWSNKIYILIGEVLNSWQIQFINYWGRVAWVLGVSEGKMEAKKGESFLFSPFPLPHLKSPLT